VHLVENHFLHVLIDKPGCPFPTKRADRGKHRAARYFKSVLALAALIVQCYQSRK
jgi:hypothetical protein